MLAGEFQRKLRDLNPELRIWCGNDDTKPAGLYIVKQNEFTEICGVDKNEVPEFSVLDSKGFFKKGGWRRTLKILLAKKLINKDRAERVFRFYFERRKYGVKKQTTDPQKRLQELQQKLIERGL